MTNLFHIQLYYNSILLSINVLKQSMVMVITNIKPNNLTLGLISLMMTYNGYTRNSFPFLVPYCLGQGLYNSHPMKILRKTFAPFARNDEFLIAYSKASTYILP